MREGERKKRKKEWKRRNEPWPLSEGGREGGSGMEGGRERGREGRTRDLV